MLAAPRSAHPDPPTPHHAQPSNSRIAEELYGASVASRRHHNMRRAGSAWLGLLLLVATVWLQPASGTRSLRPTPTRSSCEVGQQRSGCRIHAGLCVCGIGCRSEYQYADKEECTKAIKGQRRNQCGETPCQHGGTCIQTTMDPGYKCRCEGTGYHGPQCQHACPSPAAAAAVRPFLYECVVI